MTQLTTPPAAPTNGAVPGSGRDRLVLPHYLTPPLGTHPPLSFSGYRSTALRHPLQDTVELPQRLTEITGPALGERHISPADADLTRQHDVEPIGQRIVVHGRLVDSDGRPIPDALIEVWQANAAGRYRHTVDRWDAPIDPGFSGLGRTITDAQGHYKFVTIQPGAYPWRNHHNAWRPAHIHFSVYGRAFTQRLVTQMYFPGDPLLPIDPIFTSIPDPGARERLVSHFDYVATVPDWALAFTFDIVVRGSGSTPFEGDDDEDEA